MFFGSDQIFVLVRSRQRGLGPNVSLAYPLIEGRDRLDRTQIHKILNALVFWLASNQEVESV